MTQPWYADLPFLAGETLTPFALYLPRLIAAVAVLVIGVVLARLLRKGVIKVLSALQLTRVIKDTPIEHFWKDAELKHRIEDVLGTVVFWLAMLIVLHTTVGVLGLTSLVGLLERIFNYLPRIISASLVLFMGVILAGVAESVIKGVLRSLSNATARMVARVTSYLIMILAVLMAISELGIARDFILILFVGVVAGLSLALGLSFGLGGQNLVRQLLETWYTKIKAES